MRTLVTLYWISRQLLANRCYLFRRYTKECIAFIYLLRGNLSKSAKKAVKLYSKVLKLKPDSTKAYMELAALYTQEEKLDEAARCYRKVIELSDNEVDTEDFGNSLIRRIIRKFNRGETDVVGLVDDVFTKISQAQMLKAYLQLSEIYLRQNESAEAIQILNKAVELNPNNPIPYENLATAYAKTGEIEKAIFFMEKALELEPSIPWFYSRLASFYYQKGNLDQAEASCRKAIFLYYNFFEAHYMLGKIYHQQGDAEQAVTELQESLRIAPEKVDVLNLIERIKRGAKTERGQENSRIEIYIDIDSIVMDKGDSFEVNVAVKSSQSAFSDLNLYCLEPFGFGVTTNTPVKNVPYLAANIVEHLKFTLVARRSSEMNLNKPWRLWFVVTNGTDWNRVSLDVKVEDREEGTIFHIITEDHELPEFRKNYDVDSTRLVILQKSALADEIALKYGAVWTHLVEAGSSYYLIKWAAEKSENEEWTLLLREIEDYFSEVTYKGNDLGVHIHAFQIPNAPHFPFSFDTEEDRIEMSDAFLASGLLSRKYWARIYSSLGDCTEPHTRAGSLFEVLKIIEHFGRLGNPDFRAVFHRTGSHEFAQGSIDEITSILALRKLKLLVNSDVSKGSIYFSKNYRCPVYYTDISDININADSLSDIGVLEVRAEYNIESDFLSNVRIMKQIIKRKYQSLTYKSKVKPGVHFMVAMCHDKFINARMGKQWDNLNPDYKDWQTIASHLEYISTHFPKIQFATASDSVLEYYDYYTPELIAWRTNEQVILDFDDAPTQRYKYDIRLIGRDIVVDKKHQHRVSIKPPSYFIGKINRVDILKDGEIIKVFDSVVSYSDMEFVVDDKDVQYSAVVTVETVDGPTIERANSSMQDNQIHLEIISKYHFKKANLLIRQDILDKFCPNLDVSEVKTVEVANMSNSKACEYELFEQAIMLTGIKFNPQQEQLFGTSINIKL